MSDFEVGAAYVQDALSGRHYKSGLARNLSPDRSFHLRWIKLHESIGFEIFLILIITYHSLLAISEPVQMIASTPPPLSLSVVITGAFCVLVYLIDVGLSLVYTSKEDFISRLHWKLYLVLIFFVGSDYIVYAISGRMVFRLFRASLLLVRIRALRGTVFVMLWVIPKFVQFLLIMMTYIGLFAVIGVHLFMKFYQKDDEKRDTDKDDHIESYGSFDNIGIATLQIFVAMTGGNYPIIMFPAYNTVRPIALTYFITIILTGQLILYGILAARIFDFYVKANKKYVKKERFRERQCLIKSFETLDVHKSGFIHYEQWAGLLRCLRPKVSESEISKRFTKLKEIAKDEMNEERSNRPCQICLLEFFRLPEVLEFTVEVKEDEADARDRMNCRFPFLTRVVKASQRWSASEFGYCVSIGLNVFFLVPFALVWHGMSPAVARALFAVEFVLLCAIFLDIIIRLAAVGLKPEMLLHLSMALLATSCMVYIHVSGKSSSPSKGWAALVAHIAVILRLTSFRRGASSMTHWLRRMTPPLCILLCLIAIAFYTYGIIGMEWFGYLSSDSEHDTHALPRTLSLCRFGFETLGCSLLTLFQISLGSSWHRVMNYIMVEVSPWASIYFVLFYAMMQMLILNIISAVMVELSNAISTDEAVANDEENLTISPRKRQRKTNSLSDALALSGKLAGLGSHRKVTRLDEDQQTEAEIKLHESLEALKMDIEDTPNGKFKRREEASVRLTGRKVLGNWARDIAPDITFLNADEMRRLQMEMGVVTKSLNNYKETRKRRLSQNSRDSNA